MTYGAGTDRRWTFTAHSLLRSFEARRTLRRGLRPLPLEFTEASEVFFLA
jgi:hypothetical protein